MPPRFPLTGTIHKIGSDMQRVKDKRVDHILFGYNFVRIGRDVDTTINLSKLGILMRQYFIQAFLLETRKRVTGSSYSSFIQSISKISAVAKSCICFSVKNRIRKPLIS